MLFFPVGNWRANNLPRQSSRSSTCSCRLLVDGFWLITSTAIPLFAGHAGLRRCLPAWAVFLSSSFFFSTLSIKHIHIHIHIKVILWSTWHIYLVWCTSLPRYIKLYKNKNHYIKLYILFDTLTICDQVISTESSSI